MIFRCSQINGGEVVQDVLRDFISEQVDGLAFFTPINQNDERNQDLHCILLSWGGKASRKSLKDAVEHVQENFVSSLFQVDYCDHIIT